MISIAVPVWRLMAGTAELYRPLRPAACSFWSRPRGPGSGGIGRLSFLRFGLGAQDDPIRECLLELYSNAFAGIWGDPERQFGGYKAPTPPYPQPLRTTAEVAEQNETLKPLIFQWLTPRACLVLECFERLGNSLMAPRAGFEPATIRLTVGCSTAELPRKRANRSFARGCV